MPQHPVIKNFQEVYVRIQYPFHQKLWQSPMQNFHSTAYNP